jgi:hypothetical protein
MKTKTLVLASMAAAGFLVATTASAQSINFRVQSTVGTVDPMSLNDPAFFPYGAAAGAAGAGHWNEHQGPWAGTPIALNDLNGDPAGVTMTLTTGNAITAALGSTSNNPGNWPGTGDPLQNLLAGVWDLGGTAQPARTLTFSGLAAGTYDVYTYAMAPDSATFVTGVEVDGVFEQVGGAFGGNFALGITHSLHTIDLMAGDDLDVILTTVTSFGSLAGIQLVHQVPGPGAMALLGIPGLLVGSRRRS